MGVYQVSAGKKFKLKCTYKSKLELYMIVLFYYMKMVNSLLNTAQQLKGMIEHAKLQAEAAKDAAITQVKLQAEAEKKEVSAVQVQHTQG